jgi:ABC-type phosphate transport system substrate-binding protein
MHRLRHVIAAVAVVATSALAVTVTPALADPVGSSGKAIVPKAYDVVGVGADTDEFLFDQLSLDYNATVPAKKHSASDPYFYNWDATKPGSTSTAPTTIVPKAGCVTTTRPNGGNAGLKTLDDNTLDGKTGKFCIDFARTSSGRSATSPVFGPGGVAYVAVAEDAVTYATRDTGATKTVPATYAPKNLSTAQLKKIFLCTDTNWSQVGGANQPIKAYLPQAGAATTTFWLKALGITEPGSCVNQSLEQNQGLSKQFNSPNAIFIYSVADWIAQKYHSAAVGHKPAKSQNEFGSNQTGFLGLNKIDGVSPVTTAKVPTINKAFKSTHFTRTIYDIVRYAKTADHIPAYLDRFFANKGRKGFICSNPTAIKAIESYGFLPAATCGIAS